MVTCRIVDHRQRTEKQKSFSSEENKETRMLPAVAENPSTCSREIANKMDISFKSLTRIFNSRTFWYDDFKLNNVGVYMFTSGPLKVYIFDWET